MRAYWIYFFSALLLIVSLPAAGQTVVKYIHTDALRSVVAVTDASANVIERREYEPYGSQLTPAVQDGPGYTGHVQDAATNLVYMQQRYYHPQLGVFLSTDPVETIGQPVVLFNRYRYANGNPYKYIDPDGEFGIAGFFIGAGLETVQQIANGEGSFANRIRNIDKSDVAIAGVVGAVTGGIAGGLATKASAGTIAVARAAADTGKAAGSAAALGSGAQDVANGESPNGLKMGASAIIGGVAGGVGARVGLTKLAELERAAASSAPGAPNIASTTLSANRAGEVMTTTGQSAAQVVVDATAGAVDKAVQRRIEE
ncbi:RHS repeat-associated core domain-containing protein [Luteimonas sp. YGD11-2]|uniref:RHS repeat-associated core domain-containing protein n=1 Tax=Luteimonas sp. YGD11-2 TaxID=2508168 RepID=UPI00100A9655|nr:RHS repeat-associated core domain-containing protein [Luteimonas sp. YGD11-2]